MVDNIEKRFKLMTVQFDPEPKTAHLTCSSVEQALNALMVPGSSDCFVSVSIFKGNVELGEFDLSCSGCRAEALIFDCDAVAARDPQNTAEGEWDVAFKDKDGGSMTVPFLETVPRDLATMALFEWLRGCDRPPMLTWHDNT